MTEATCQHCGKKIIKISDASWGWRHMNLPELNRGCRAASFTPEHGWDDTLDRKWKAKPQNDEGPHEEALRRMTVAEYLSS